MIDKLRSILVEIVYLLRAGEDSAAMKLVAVFVSLFQEFLQQNSSFIFDHEISELNRCLSEMVVHIENNDGDSLLEMIETTLKTFLDRWDFNNSLVN